MGLTPWENRPNFLEQLRIHSLAWDLNFKSLYYNELPVIASTTDLVVQKAWVGRLNASYRLIIVSYSDTTVAKWKFVVFALLISQALIVPQLSPLH